MSKKRLVVFGPVSGDHLNRWLRPFLSEFDIHVITLHPDEQQVEGVTYETLPRPTGFRLDFAFCVGRLRKRLLTLKPDVVHVHYLSSYGISYALAKVRFPAVLSVWGTDVNKGLYQGPLAWLSRWSLSAYRAINSPSQNIAKKLAEKGVPPERIHVFQYGVKTSQLPIRQIDPTKDHFDLVSFRDWAPLYRIPLIIDLFAQAASVDQKIRLHLYGRHTDEQKEFIRQKVEQSGAADRIHLVGYVPYDVMLERLAQMDIMISLPTMDGMPLALLESNYIGQWPLLSDIPANNEWAQPNLGTILVRLSGEEFKNALNEAKILCRDPKRIAELRAKVLSEGDFDANMEKMRAIFHSLSGSKT